MKFTHHTAHFIVENSSKGATTQITQTPQQ